MNNALVNFENKLVERLQAYKLANGYTYFDRYEVEHTEGKKFYKVLRVEVRADGGRHSILVCFIDKNTGEIFKPASWQAPAKHARGNINSPNFGMEAIDDSGNVYYLK